MQGIPKQFIGKGCAYFVMFFMKSIVNDDMLDFGTKVNLLLYMYRFVGC